MDEWPVYTPHKFYLHANGTLLGSKSVDKSGHSFIYDPTKPVPTVGGNNLPSISEDCEVNEDEIDV